MFNKARWLTFILAVILLTGSAYALRINEVELNPEGDGDPWVELYSELADLRVSYLENSDGDRHYIQGANPGYSIVHLDEQFMNSGEDKLYLKHFYTDQIIDETPVIEDNQGDDFAWSRCLTGSWKFRQSTIGLENICEIVTDLRIKINGKEMDKEGTATLYNGEANPIEVTFTSIRDMENVQVIARVIGESEIYDVTKRLNIVNGNTYSEILELNIPADQPTADSYILEIEIETPFEKIGYRSIPSIMRIPIYGCQELNTKGGNYELRKDIIDAQDFACLQITNDNISLDGKNYLINADTSVQPTDGDIFPDNGGIIGISVYNAEKSIGNIIVENITLSEWYSEAISVESANKVLLEDLNVRSTYSTGIDVRDSEEVTIKSSQISPDGRDEGLYGIILINSHNSLIDDNVLTGHNGRGILARGNQNTISNNLITLGQTGIFLSNSNNNHIFNNDIINNGDNAIVITLSNDQDQSSHNTVENNNIVNNYRGIEMISSSFNLIRENLIEDNVERGIIIRDFFRFPQNNSNLVEGNIIRNNGWQGINIMTINNKIIDNEILNNGREGIEVEESSGNIIERNNVVDNEQDGIDLNDATNNEIKNNLINENAIDGINLDESINNSIENNQLIDNGQNGIDLRESTNNLIKNNQIEGNGFGGLAHLDYSGIELDDESAENILEDNKIFGNKLSGIFTLQGASDNLIYNNLLNNTINYYSWPTSPGGENSWNFTKTKGTNIVGGRFIGGNYWAKPDGTGFSQTCNDSDNNGICDDPYVLGDNNIDYLPLTMIEPPPVNTDLSLEIVRSLTRNQSGILSIENNGNIPLNNIMLSSTGDLVDLSIDSLDVLNDSLDEWPQVEVSIPNPDNLNFGNNEVTITAESDEGASDSETFNVQKTFCDAGTVNASDIELSIDINNNGEGDDESWRTLDDIEITVEVQNEGSEEWEDVIIELGLIDEDGNDVSEDLDFENDDEEKIDLGNVDEDSSEEGVFEFRVNSDIEKGNYKLAIKAYSDDLGEENSCIDSSDDLEENIYEPIEIESVEDEGKFVVIDDIIMPEELMCGESITGSLTLLNVGDEDQDKVRINIESDDLNIDTYYEIANLDEGDEKDIDFNIPLPSNIEGSYDLEFTTEYDYDDGDYDESSEETWESELRVECDTQVIFTELSNDIQPEQRIIRLNSASRQPKSFLEVLIDWLNNLFA